MGFLLITLGAVLGGVCGAGYCSPDAPEEQTLPLNNESKFSAFTTTDELYQAVDIYLLHLTEDPRNSIVAQKYGYPIGTWDVSRIKNFSLVFAPAAFRGSHYDLLLPPVMYVDEKGRPLNFSDFNEDISGWNVSAAETMYGMFFGCNQFDQNLTMWDVSNVKNVRRYASN
jgi:hypothetical protein